MVAISALQKVSLNPKKIQSLSRQTHYFSDRLGKSERLYQLIYHRRVVVQSGENRGPLRRLTQKRKLITRLFGLGVSALLILVLVFNVESHTIIQKINVGKHPSRAVITPDGSEVYVSNRESNSVSVIKTTTNEVIKTISVGLNPQPLAISSDGKWVYVGNNHNEEEGSVDVIDTNKKNVVRTISTDGPVRDLAITPNGRKIYMAMERGGLGKIEIPNYSYSVIDDTACPESVVFKPDDGKRAYVNYQCAPHPGSRGHDPIFVFDAESDQLLTKISHFQDGKRIANVGSIMAISPDGSQVWANGADACSRKKTDDDLFGYDFEGCPSLDPGESHKGRGIINIIDTQKNKIIRAFAFPGHDVGKPTPLGAAIPTFSPGGLEIAVTTGSRILIFDTRTLIQTDSIEEIVNAGNLVFTPDGARAYVPVPGDDSITVLEILEPPLPTTRDIILNWAGVLVSGVTVIHFVFFLFLLIRARWSQRCFNMLMDPTLRKIGIYFWFLLQHVTIIQLWVFERYFKVAKKNTDMDSRYVPVLVTCSDGSHVISSDLIRSFPTGSRIWISGEAGTGKTAIVEALMRRYFAESSLRKAWKKFGFIPIMVTVRAHTGITFGSESQWVPEVARAALQGMGFSFKDAQFFQGLLESGSFAILLDGLNEEQRDDDVKRYANAAPSVRLFITSQASSGDTKISEYQLPRANRDFVKQLLEAFLGPDGGAAVFAKLSDALLEEVRSGYDILLIADLHVSGQPIPRDRLGLYHATLDAVRLLGGERYQEEVICRVAWDLWLAGNRRFQEDKRLTKDLLLPLQRVHIVVPRGDTFEFRHDLLRGYLAARWAKCHATSVVEFISRLANKNIWQLSPSEHDIVFPFLTAIIKEKEDLQAVAQFAAEDPDRRVRLQAAAHETAKRRGWSLSVILG